MKKLFTLILLISVVFGSTSFAQTSTGRILIGGSSNMDMSFGKDKWKDANNSEDRSSYFRFNLSPTVGYFVIDGLAVGASLPFTLDSQKGLTDGNKDEYSSSSVVLAPFVKYYFGANNIKPFALVSAGFGSAKETYTPEVGDTSEDKSGISMIQIGGGVALFLNDNFALDFGIGYTSTSRKRKEDNPDDFKNIQSGIGITIGISVIL